MLASCNRSIVRALTNVNATVNFGVLTLGASTNRVLTIRNVGTGPLTGLALSCDGANAADFVVGSPGAWMLLPGTSTTVAVTFAPVGVASGQRSGTLHLASNDADETPFLISLAGNAFSTVADVDGDGLPDWTEYRLAPLGFDWQVSQPSLVNTLTNGANVTGLYTLAQVQALNLDSPLLALGAGGILKLTIGLQKATNLVEGFIPFPFQLQQIATNAQGQLEFIFSPTDNAAFFRLEAH